jgi:hypothetical protein
VVDRGQGAICGGNSPVLYEGGRPLGCRFVF